MGRHWTPKPIERPIPPPTRPERILYDALEKAGVVFDRQYRVGPFRADAYVKRLNMVIEIDGEYWHERPAQKRRDRRKDNYYLSHGYLVARVPSKKFMSDPEGWIRRWGLSKR